MAIDQDKLRRFAELSKRKARLEDELETLSRELGPLNAALVTMFAQSGTQRTTVDGVTVSLRRDVVPDYPQGRDAVVKVLKETGYGEYVKEDFNYQSVGSLLRDLTGAKDKDRIELDLDALPPEWKGILFPHEKYTVRATAG